MASSSRQSTVFIPNEILTIIFANLPKKADLKVVRLVCQQWCSLAPPSLFHTIYFSPWPKDLDVFSQWTLNERCRTAVRELVYDASRMEPASSEGNYAEIMLSRHLGEFRKRSRDAAKFVNLGCEAMHLLEYVEKEQLGLVRRMENSELLKYQVVRQGYQAHRQQNRLYIDMHRSGKILRYLTRGIQQLMNLESVRIVDSLNWDGEEDDDDFRPTMPGPMRQRGSPFARSWHPLYLHPVAIIQTNRNSIGMSKPMNIAWSFELCH